MGTAESIFLGEDEVGGSGGTTTSMNSDPFKNRKSPQPKVVGYVIGDAQTGKSSLLCRLRGEDDLTSISNESDANKNIMEEVILPWSLLQPSSPPSHNVDFHVRTYHPTNTDESSSDMISFALFLIHPKRLQSTLTYAEATAKDILQEQLHHATSAATDAIPPWISLCFLLNFCDEDAAVTIEESFFQQIQQVAQRIQKFQTELYLPYYNSIITTKTNENNDENNNYCSYCICSSMKTCYGLQALYSFFPIVYHRWKEWNTIQTILQVQKNYTLHCHKTMQKMAQLNQRRFFQKQKLKQEQQGQSGTTVKDSNRPQLPPTTATITTDKVTLKDSEVTAEKQLQLERLRKLQKKQGKKNSEPYTQQPPPLPTKMPIVKLHAAKSTSSSDKVDAQKVLDLFLAEDDEDDDYKDNPKNYGKPFVSFKEEENTTNSEEEEEDDDFYYDQQGKKQHAIEEKHQNYDDSMKHHTKEDKRHQNNIIRGKEEETTNSEEDDDFYYDQQGKKQHAIEGEHQKSTDKMKQHAIEYKQQQKNNVVRGSAATSKSEMEGYKEQVVKAHPTLTSDDGWDWDGEEEAEESEMDAICLPSPVNSIKSASLDEDTINYHAVESSSHQDIYENEVNQANPSHIKYDEYDNVEEVKSTPKKRSKDKRKSKKNKSP